ncbi:Tigger transposable element-derived protein 7-like 78 [Homarus americanus]|uniref:Tigger transposable element-derived protein 7-like 78 n=1 Tax=Homarus americanus TaxID=6706 RepID=A0A8J5MWC6_HOMAM|nr:Tigger transposable element-derived protein 7-like 78 [Homarus americanus]
MLTPVVVGKSKKPRAIQGIMHRLPVDYYNSKNAWFTGAITSELVFQTFCGGDQAYAGSSGGHKRAEDPQKLEIIQLQVQLSNFAAAAKEVKATTLTNAWKKLLYEEHDFEGFTSEDCHRTLLQAG